MSGGQSDRELLARRAQLLARARTTVGASGAAQPLTRFRRGDASYAIERRFVVELATVLAPTPLPLTPPHWLGVTSLHGDMLALIELPTLLAETSSASSTVAASARGARLLIMVLGRERREFGVVIDAALDIATSLGDVARATSELLPTGRLVSGALADGTRIIDGDALLDDARMFLVEQSPNNHA